MNRALVWRTIQNSTWLLGGLILLAITFFLWIGVQVRQHIVVEKSFDQTDVPVEPEKVRFSSTLGMMTDAVPPLDLSKATTSAVYTAEFRGADYIKSQSNRWYLHVMNVTQVEVIKSYLANRLDRQQFTYFRYLEPNQPKRYILAYGSFPSVTKALDASKTVKFDLPDSVKVYPQRFSELKKFVSDEVTADSTITNLGGANQLYQVKLRAVPVPVEQPVPSSLPSANTSEIPHSQASQVMNPLSPPPNAGQTNLGSSTASQGSVGSNTAGSNGAGQPNSGSTVINSQVAPNNNSATTPKPSVPATNKPASTNNTGAPTTGQAGAATETPRPIADPFN